MVDSRRAWELAPEGQGKEQVSLRYSVLESDAQGVTYFRDEEPAWTPYFIEGVFQSAMRPASEFGYLRLSVGNFQDWHTAPGKRLVIMVSGRMEVEAGTGERREFTPGSVLLVTDTAGQGHRTRVMGDEEVVFAWVPVE